MSEQTDHFVRADVRAFLDFLESAGRPPMSELSVEEARAGMHASVHIAELPAKEMAVKRDLSCPGPSGDIPLRLYDARESREAGPVMVFFHGGGFVIGDLDTHDALCTELAASLDIPVVSVDYHLAPEHPFPAAPDDAEAAARWVASNPTELNRKATGLVLCGDSAGGNLTIVTAQSLADEPADVPVLVQAPIYPLADDIAGHQSFQDFSEGYLLTRDAMSFFTRSYAPKEGDVRNWPILRQAHDLPPAVLCTAGLDPLRDSGRNYAAHLIQAGVDVTYMEFPGIIHGFANLRKAIASGQSDLTAFTHAIAAMLERHAK
ncbi:alpha/beta hydrolase [Erythrobacter sp. LQ02-29]|uniref:alpha/beta hydrolase n=1 Tax=Erythrobacter sp. LQ02-29 TaxID=2920384 RepID=UPI001F4E0F48|nr:alpha/beta hydrolase [Erythrobacter sp. LQ02-29]MCP9223033.1 alpha/beta hydrolase [Erythrobacter sp. LQ02-29]